MTAVADLTLCIDEDWYAVTVPASGSLFASIEFIHYATIGTGDLVLELYSTDGITLLDSSYISGTTLGSSIVSFEAVDKFAD